MDRPVGGRGTAGIARVARWLLVLPVGILVQTAFSFAIISTLNATQDERAATLLVVIMGALATAAATTAAGAVAPSRKAIAAVCVGLVVVGIQAASLAGMATGIG